MGVNTNVIVGYGFIVPSDFASALRSYTSNWTYNGIEFENDDEIGIFHFAYDCYDKSDVFIFVQETIVDVPTKMRVPSGDSALIDFQVTEEQTKETRKFADFVRELTGFDNIKIGNYVFAYKT
jgi:uncharacterized ubiquitin-like protein YukD